MLVTKPLFNCWPIDLSPALNPKWGRTLSLGILHLPHSSQAHWPSYQLGITTLAFGIIHCTKSLPWSMTPREIVFTHRIFIGRRYNNFSFFLRKVSQGHPWLGWPLVGGLHLQILLVSNKLINEFVCIQ